MTVTLHINRSLYRFNGDPMTPLVDILRQERFLTGTKAVCREGFCGACTVSVDGEAIMSCLRPMGLLDGAHVLSIEAMATGDGPLHPLQAAFEAADVVQCGMCFPGMVMSLAPFLRDNPTASRDDVKSAMVGNICRCTGYERIIDAVMDYLGQPAEEHVHD
ncbi:MULTISPECIES: (2Fe-2S)-binding protein [unclassified Rhizobium]|uniref:(2Fe-2S)-binding protein n=1 Tax=unclassified Rhizobium TaxID=2613769 RepID=UPI001ADA285B|nr:MULTISPECIES: (2Fe-2S)-binding protein [unclassified Rhizobium]MBO9100620.1 (2Fe-2S)-binding protein [Rhizobium sp. L58/93]MBO9136018.1 (2Fe-2S)-binding protein [Rhizobium sp. B209b/85]MBO9171329.1 (2Fe-2S)-binding protein [Rhizobium sp. L245/93]MBO9187196.1 (2Fe-2S)-binding protein [Rhizobium sp. E27B/91]QXZ87882.1 (2Fe-2S)-binding protein [Rhizobium sp. K1/93]